ncbi:hypothetical protein OH77DRAFT_721220 [Trametes cingulata]|nr:hypothetical protein OH77DRAFT_721220 [Trametes cingulata]
MKHLRRNRTTSLSTPSPSTSTSPSALVSAPAPLSPSGSRDHPSHSHAHSLSQDTPLYARFTGARRGEDGSALKLKPLVSGPIALAPKRSAPQVQVQAPLGLQQQKSSGSGSGAEGREERREERRKLREEARELEKARSKAALKEKEGGTEQAQEGKGKVAEKAQNAERPEVARMRSDETAASGASGSTAGRHGTRIEGERVLLPARKVTQKRVVANKTGEASGSGQARGEDGPSASISKNAEASSSKVQEKEELGKQQKESEVRPAAGERVPLPARKVTRKRIVDADADAHEKDAPLPSSSSATPSPHNRPTLEDSRSLSEGAASASTSTSAQGSPSKSKDASPPARVHNEVRQKTSGPVHVEQARTKSPEPQASSSSPIVFPASQAPAPSPSPAIPASTSTGAVVVIDPEGGEDKFSRPKRARMHTLATTSLASNPVPTSRPSESERPTSPSRPVIEPSKASEGAKATTSPAVTAKPAAAPSLTSQPSTSSVATTTGAAPPRRRKYSLLAAFGLPVARSTSDSDTSTPAGGPSTSSAHQAKVRFCLVFCTQGAGEAGMHAGLRASGRAGDVRACLWSTGGLRRRRWQFNEPVMPRRGRDGDDVFDRLYGGNKGARDARRVLEVGSRRARANFERTERASRTSSASVCVPTRARPRCTDISRQPQPRWHSQTQTRSPRFWRSRGRVEKRSCWRARRSPFKLFFPSPCPRRAFPSPPARPCISSEPLVLTARGTTAPGDAPSSSFVCPVTTSTHRARARSAPVRPSTRI